MDNLIESIKVNSFIRELGNVPKGFFTWSKFNFQIVGELSAVLGFPIIAAEESNKVSFKQISFFVMVETIKDKLHHIFVDNEARKDVVGSDPFIEGNKEKFFVSSSYTVKSIIEGWIMLRENDTNLLLDICQPIFILADHFDPVNEGNSTVFVRIHYFQ